MHRWLAMVVFFGAVACGGGADVGEGCDSAGSTDECVDGAVCTNGETGSTCRRVCKEDDECGAAEACNGVSGTNIKSCQPKEK
jgi:hypothetical protein